MVSIVYNINRQYNRVNVFVPIFFCSDSIDSAVEKYGLQKVSLLRLFCNKAGIQLLLREYNLESKNKAVFFEDDIVNVYPIVKHVHPKVSPRFLCAGKVCVRWTNL